jgi:hypothetical protein
MMPWAAYLGIGALVGFAARNAADLGFERCANRSEVRIRGGFQPPQHDMSDHQR